MPNLTLNISDKTGGYLYRPLRLTAPIMAGADVFALQTALVKLAPTVTLDGVSKVLVPDGALGRVTDKAIYVAQQRLGMITDRVAGIKTQQALGDISAQDVRDKYDLPIGALYGQLEYECGWQLGNFTPIYVTGTAAGTRDRGCTQMNDGVYPDDVAAYDVRMAIDVLGNTISINFSKYKAYSKVSSLDRLWDLAQGSWNAPAWTDTLARGGTLSSTQKNTIESYIEAVTAYRVR